MQILKTKRDRSIFAVIIAVLAVILYLLLGTGSDDDSNGSSTEGNGDQRLEHAVTILIVDDFGDHIRRITTEVDSAEFQSVAQTLQALEGPGTSDLGTAPSSQDAVATSQGTGGPPTPATVPPTTATVPPTLVPTTLPPSQDQVSEIIEANFAEMEAQTREVINSHIEDGLESSNCAVTPEGQGFFTTGGAGFFTTGGAGFFTTGGAGATTAHGTRVHSLLAELVATYGSKANITLIDVDTEGFKTEIIGERILQTIEQIRRENPDMNFVVNMSFAVVPCTAVPTLVVYQKLMEQFDSPTEQNLHLLELIFNDLIMSGAYQSTLTANDRLEEDFGGTVILVGAAGNASAAFPFYPAAWPAVISISASDDVTDFVAASGRASYSNTGRVLMPGTWNASDGPQLGTSFAAPRYSFLMAMHLAGAGVDICGNGSPVTPALPDSWNPPPPASDQNRPLC